MIVVREYFPIYLPRIYSEAQNNWCHQVLIHFKPMFSAKYNSRVRQFITFAPRRRKKFSANSEWFSAPK